MDNKYISLSNYFNKVKRINENFLKESEILKIKYADFLIKTGRYEEATNYLSDADKLEVEELMEQKKNFSLNYKNLLKMSPFSKEMLYNAILLLTQKSSYIEAEGVLGAMKIFEDTEEYKKAYTIVKLCTLNKAEAFRHVEDREELKEAYTELYSQVFDYDLKKELTRKETESLILLINVLRNRREELYSMQIFRPLHVKALQIVTEKGDNQLKTYERCAIELIKATDSPKYKEFYIAYLVRGHRYDTAMKMYHNLKVNSPRLRKTIEAYKQKKDNRAKEREDEERERRKGKRVQDSRGYYRVLGVQPHATDKEVGNRHVDLRQKYQKEANSKNKQQKERADKMLLEIGKAYSVIGDPKKRAQYDAGTYKEEREFQSFNQNNRNNQRTYTYNTASGDFEDFFKAFGYNNNNNGSYTYFTSGNSFGNRNRYRRSGWGQ